MRRRRRPRVGAPAPAPHVEIHHNTFDGGPKMATMTAIASALQTNAAALQELARKLETTMLSVGGAK